MITSTARPLTEQGVFAGAGFVFRFLVKRDALRLAVWVTSLVTFCAFFLAGNRAVYRTAEDRLNRAASMSGPGGVFLTGPGYGLDDYTIGAMFANEMTIWLMVLLAVMNILQMTRATRDEEADGRAELVRALPVGRHAPLLAAVGVVVVADIIFALLGTLVLAVFGLGVRDSLAMMVGVAACALVFAGFATLTCQLTVHGRGASGIALSTLGVAVLVRGIGDILEPHGSWMTWLSPIAWTQQMRPYVDLRLWPLTLSFVVAAALMVLGAALTARRDLGAALVADRPGPSGAALSSPLALTARLQRTALCWWLVGCVIMFGATGLVAGADFRDALEAIAAQNDLTAMIFGADPMAAFMSLMMVHNALAACVYAIGAMLRSRSEEDHGRLALTLSRPASRGSVLGARLLVVGLGIVVLVIGGGALPLWLGSQIAGGDIALSSLLVSGASFVLAVLAVLAFTAAVYAWAPRLTALAWVLFGVVVFETFFAGLVNLPEVVRALSPFWWAGDYPVAPVDPNRLVALAVGAVALAVAAFVGFRRRDLTAG